MKKPKPAFSRERLELVVVGLTLVGIIFGISYRLTVGKAPSQGLLTGSKKKSVTSKGNQKKADTDYDLSQSAPDQAKGVAHPRVDSIQASLETAQRYLDQAQYPPFTQPLESPGADPVLSKYRIYPKTSHSLSAHAPVLSAWTEKIDFIAPEPVVIYAALEAPEAPQGKSVSADIEVKVLSLESSSASAEVLPLVRFEKVSETDSDQPLYKAVLDFSQKGSEAIGSYTAVVKAYSPKLKSEATLSVGFNVSAPRVQLTGKFKDQIIDRFVVIDAQVRVDHPGRFYLEGSLYAEDDTPIAWAENALNLETGTHWIPLRFYGKVLKDRGIAGPYRLKHLSIARTGVIPNMRAPLWTKAYLTQAYALNQLASEPYQDAALIESAQQLIKDAEDQRRQRR